MNNVLLVEDEKPLLEKMANNIDWKENDYRVFTASNGEKALRVLEETTIDILVTDIKMPRMSGIELIKKIRNTNQRIIPIIISGYAEFEYARESIKLDVTEYILKPFRSFKLLEVVDKAREKLKEQKRERQELKRLKSELNKILNGELDLDIFSELMFANEEVDIYNRQVLVLKNEEIFQELKKGKREKLLEEIDALCRDIKKKDPGKEDLYIILNNIVLLAFKSLKDMGYEIKNIVKYLKEKGNQENLSEINNNIRDWLTEFFLLINQLITDSSKGEDRMLIEKVKEVIKEDYSSGITLGELADRFNVSNGYLSRLFYENTGKKFSKYLDNIRINRAKELLKTTDDKIYQIADKVGFEDPYYFSSWFKKRVGVSPTTYRDNLLLFE